MKKIVILLLSGCILQPASALPSFDPFADATLVGGSGYEVGGALTNQFNPTLFSAWYSRGANFPGIQPTIVAGNLQYPGMTPSSGNSVSFGPASAMSACLNLNIFSNSPAPVYCSFLLKITDLTAVSTAAANNPFAAFLDDPAAIGNQIGRLGSRILTKKVGVGYVLGTSKKATFSELV
jgi:hypothetical protein